METVQYCSIIHAELCLTFWIVHHLLHHRVVQDSSHHLWIAHQLVLHPRLEIHESARVGAESLETRQSTDLVQSKWCLANVSWSTDRAFGFRLWWRLNHLKYKISQRLKFAASKFHFTTLTKCTVNPSLML